MVKKLTVFSLSALLLLFTLLALPVSSVSAHGGSDDDGDEFKKEVKFELKAENEDFMMDQAAFHDMIVARLLSLGAFDMVDFETVDIEFEDEDDGDEMKQEFKFEAKVENED